MNLRRRTRLAVPLVLLGLVSCGGEPPADGADDTSEDPVSEPPPGTAIRDDPRTDTTMAGTPSAPSTWAYTCRDGPRITVHYREDDARVGLPARELVLPRDSSASGARYASDDGLFWDRGDEAVLQVGSDPPVECRGRRAETPEDAARLLGFDFRGLGQEPGWLVDIDADRQIRWTGDYGDVRFATGAPDTEEREDGTLVWSAGTGEHRITVRAIPGACRDVMSGRPFSHTVEVTAGDRGYSGCGLWLDGG